MGSLKGGWRRQPRCREEHVQGCRNSSSWAGHGWRWVPTAVKHIAGSLTCPQGHPGSCFPSPPATRAHPGHLQAFATPTLLHGPRNGKRKEWPGKALTSDSRIFHRPTHSPLYMGNGNQDRKHQGSVGVRGRQCSPGGPVHTATSCPHRPRPVHLPSTSDPAATLHAHAHACTHAHLPNIHTHHTGMYVLTRTHHTETQTPSRVHTHSPPRCTENSHALTPGFGGQQEEVSAALQGRRLRSRCREAALYKSTGGSSVLPASLGPAPPGLCAVSLPQRPQAGPGLRPTQRLGLPSVQPPQALSGPPAPSGLWGGGQARRKPAAGCRGRRGHSQGGVLILWGAEGPFRTR